MGSSLWTSFKSVLHEINQDMSWNILGKYFWRIWPLEKEQARLKIFVGLVKFSWTVSWNTLRWYDENSSSASHIILRRSSITITKRLYVCWSYHKIDFFYLRLVAFFMHNIKFTLLIFLLLLLLLIDGTWIGSEVNVKVFFQYLWSCYVFCKL